MTPEEAVQRLHALPLRELRGVPQETGIYALADHEHRFRYIGSTGDADFRARVQNRHVTGTEGRSHQFSWAYNIGRMFRGPKSANPDVERDRAEAKTLRTAFIRRHCRAVWMPLPGSRTELEALEHAMIRVAPREAVLWNGMWRVPSPVVEPRDLVDRLISDLGLSAAAIARLDRQAARHLGAGAVTV